MIQNKLKESLLLLPGTSIFSDTMFASTVSRRGYRCAQVYATDFGWARPFWMASINETHETLSLLFDRDGFLPSCICDDAKEMVQSKFHQKLKDAACHLKQLEPYTIWANAKEASMHLWDDWLELEDYITSNTAPEIYIYDRREVLETVMSCKT